MAREYRGEQGHFFRKCYWHICTHVNGVRVSTVGEIIGDEKATMGSTEDGMMYETMVFVLNERGEPKTWTEIASNRYRTKEEAMAGHEDVCKEFELYA